MDPDSDYVSDEAESDGDRTEDGEDHSAYDDGSVLNDDERLNLVPFDLEDDEEDLRETPRPLQLRECLELLRTSETHDQAYTCHETALAELPRLIQQSPDDLPDFAVPLAVQLLRTENKFNIDRFSDMRNKSLCSLTVQEPLSVGGRLIHELFQDGGLADRIIILATLQDAIFSLSGGKVEHEHGQSRYD